MRTIRPHDFIKHEAFMDVCLEVTKVFDYGHGLQVQAIWWNMAFVTSYPIGYKVRLNIAKKETDLKPQAGRRTHLKQWEVLAPESRADQCLRKSKWLKAG